MEELCSPRYSRGNHYRRGGSYTKRLVTFLGEVTFKVKRVINRADRSVRSPILGALDARRRRYPRNVRTRLTEFASTMSYGDARREYEATTGVHVPKRAIHSFIQEIAPRLLEAGKMSAKAKISHRGLHQGPSPLQHGDEQRARTHLRRRADALPGVNETWPRAKADVLVSDGEPGLVNSVEAGSRQLCVLHAFRHLQFTMWREGMSPEERHEAGEAVQSP